MRQFIILPFLAAAFAFSACSREPNESAAWRSFQADRSSSALPDYSYAGYDYMESPIPDGPSELFAVEDFGAIADDELSDRDAVQAALDAASVEGGVVFFRSGRYLLNTVEGVEKPLRLSKGNVVIRGAGSGEAGTSLVFERALDPEDPDKMYSTPFLLHIEPKSRRETFLSKVEGQSDRGSFTLSVADPSKFSVGDWITLRLQDPQAVSAFFGDRPTRPEWTRLQTDGIGVSERHQVVAVEGSVLTLREPLQVPVDSRFDWSVQDYPAIEEVGIESLRFVGGWKGDFVHHRSALDDGGWSGIRIRSVRNGWIRDVAMNDWNYGMRLDDCSAFSVLRVRLGGTPGHHAMHARGGYGVLFGLVSDTAAHYHGPGVGYMAASTVFWRCEHTPENSFDAHSGGPYATLLDACSGGWKYGRSGGPRAGMPNHAHGLTVWNFERTGGEEEEFDFWRVRLEFDDRDLFLNPNIIGFHGIETRFNEASLGIAESIGAPVEPESLFEAQLSLRLGGIPEHLKRELELWQSSTSED